MDNQGQESKYNISLLRGWQRSQLKLLKEFVIHDFLSQTKISMASGSPPSPNAIGGKMTPLIRAGLIEKAGKDENKQYIWQLNEKTVERKTLQDLLDEMHIE